MNKQTILNAYVAVSRKLISLTNDIEANQWWRTVRVKDGEPTKTLDELNEVLFENKAVLLRQLSYFESRLDVSPVGKLEARRWTCKLVTAPDFTEIKPEYDKDERLFHIIVKVSWEFGAPIMNFHTPEQALEMAKHLKVLAEKLVKLQGS